MTASRGAPDQTAAGLVKLLSLGPANPVAHLAEWGPASVRLELPAIRELRCGGVEVVRAVLVAVRDRNWGTVPANLTVCQREISSQGLFLDFSCEHDNGDVGFVWDGEIRGTARRDGGVKLSYSIAGRASRPFRANRVGFCLLHPAEAAGASVTLRTVSGTSHSAFPAQISPWQPFRDLVGMSYSLGGAAVEMTFEGDIFETEDQRNWTDASFKTYCPPLSLPFPRQWEVGEEIRQRVTIVLKPADERKRGRRRAGGEPVAVRLGEVTRAKLPLIGLGAAQHEGHVREDEVEALRRLRLHHVHVVVDPSEEGWVGGLSQQADIVSQLGVSLQGEVVVDDPGQLEAVAETWSEFLRDGLALGPVMLFDQATSVTTRPLVSNWKSQSAGDGRWPAVFAGSRANFAEFNRAELPYDLVAGVTFALNPQVHAFSKEEIAQTLRVHEAVARQAISMAGGLPLHVGPITLLPRFNAVATEKTTPTRPPADARQRSLFTAAWTLGSISGLASGGAFSLTYFETVGAGGVLDRRIAGRPELFPVYEVLRALASCAGARIVAATIAPHSEPVALLAVDQDEALTLLIGNLGPAELTIRVERPDLPFRARLLDLGAAERMLEGQVAMLTEQVAGHGVVRLAAYEVAFLTPVV